MSNVAAAHINIAEMMSHEDNQNAVEQLKAALEANPAVQQMVDAAQSLEEMYVSLKQHISLKLEDFKVVFYKALEYMVPSKTRLEDDMMDCVSGGGKYLDKYVQFKKDIKTTLRNTIISVAILAGMLIVGTAAGAALGSKLC